MNTLLSFNSNPFKVKESTMSHFGENLFKWRKEAGLSLRALAEKADLSPTYIDNIEKNKPHSVSGALPSPSRASVVALSRACNVADDIALRAAGYLPNNAEEEFQSAAAAYSATTSQRVLTLGTDSDAAALTQNGETVLVKMPEEQLQVLKDFNANFANFAKMMKQNQ